MTFADHHDVFIGSADDGWTFAVLNRRIPAADAILTRAGFTAREDHGRSVYLLPPGTSEDAHERAGMAMYGLLAHTMDFVDLASTTRGPISKAAVHFRFADGTVTATAATDKASGILTQHGFIPSEDPARHVLPADMGEREAVNTVVRAEAHLYAEGLGVRIDLGIPTPAAIPTAARRTSQAVLAGPTAARAQRRTR
ncbi:hypothetical protein NLX86_25780 [Streptomyces sp. A3M-1-3]|uniref:hypothetical protein n=1 Tax=Streptomyces sp. A3M-1-3 TaxID=2962044 RepID=UPI0020B688B4|nr:hypothetical protein [Streptomyces sp. A3M-1-3]MCP3821381.1 hypothetical protein [Streptomyces sp. A3M-1-3]